MCMHVYVNVYIPEDSCMHVYKEERKISFKILRHVGLLAEDIF